MSITKRARVSFDINIVYSSDAVAQMEADTDYIVREVAAQVEAGKVIPGFIQEVVKSQLTGGIESVIELYMKKVTKVTVTEALLESDAKSVSNFRVAIRK